MRLTTRLRLGVSLAACFALLVVSGCSHDPMTADRRVNAAAGELPKSIVVTFVPDMENIANTAANATPEVGDALAFEVVGILQQRRLPARLANAGPNIPDAIYLDLRLLRLAGGSRWKRMVVGFGMGRSQLQVSAVLRPGQDRDDTFLVFQIDAGSGQDPGAATALLGLVAGNFILPAVQGGASAARLSGLGTEQDVRDTALAIADRLNQFFRTAGWIGWTTAPNSILKSDQHLPPPVPTH